MKKLKLLILTLCLSTFVKAQTSGIKMYGYFDLEFEYNAGNEQRWDMDQHHFNVVTIYQIDKQWRVFSEIEWEHGISIEADKGKAKGSGMVALERAWVEYKYSPKFKVKAGKFLIPFGLLNLSHDATPTILLSFLPSSIYGTHTAPAGYKSRLYPKFGNGVQVLGNLGMGDGTLSYAAYISNGEGATPYKKDDNKNKAIGARALYSFMDDDMSLGLSYYTQEFGNSYNTQHNVFALDVKAVYDAFGFQAEAFFPELEGADVDTAGKFVPNGKMTSALGYYTQLWYTFIDIYTPVFQYNFYDGDTDVANNEETRLTFGLNIAVTGQVFLKGEYQLLRFDDSNKNYNTFISSISVAF